MSWFRRLSDELTSDERAAIQSAKWNGRIWSVQDASPTVLKSLEAEKLIEWRNGMWLLTLRGHRFRRAAPRPGK